MKWLREKELHLRPIGYEPIALLLSYRAVKITAQGTEQAQLHLVASIR
jgi:hypothetical protein